MDYKPTSPREIRDILAQRNFAPRKSLGQNFLIDRNILVKITDAAQLEPSDVVLEIGPGLGALTMELLERGCRVVAVEYDRGLFGILGEQFAQEERLTLYNEDFMQFDLSRLAKFSQSGKFRGKVVANLPYYITTPAIFKLVEAGIRWESLVFLIQKEVAQRITAEPGGKDYGALTVMLNFYGQVDKIMTVPKTVFYPAPQVDSAVVRIRPFGDPERQELYPHLHRVVQAAFGQRRKTIQNALQSVVAAKDQIQQLLAALNITPTRRGETLNVAEFTALAMAVRQLE